MKILYNYLVCSIFSIVILGSCAVQKKCRDCAVIKMSLMYYDEMQKEYIEKESFWPTIRILYKDSMAIDEIKFMNIHRDSTGIITKDVNIIGYAFTDIRKRWVYKYKTFSDTARLLSKHLLSDTLGIMHQKYEILMDSVPNEQPPIIMSDTLIDNINYKRRKIVYFSQPENKVLYTYIIYYRCDIDNQVLSFGGKKSRIKGCTGVRHERIMPDGTPDPASMRIIFMDNKFTKEELKVFDAWEKNAKNNPVVNN